MGTYCTIGVWVGGALVVILHVVEIDSGTNGSVDGLVSPLWRPRL
jgi:hypothetical protein